MQDFAAAIAEALRLIAAFDANLAEIVGLSLQVSLAASFCAALIGLPVGALIAIGSFRGRSILILLLNALMGLPPVVVGLVVYLMLSNAGPMGGFGLLYSPAAMIIAQTVLVAPIVAALGRQTDRGPAPGIRRAAARARRGAFAGGADAALGRPLQPAHGLPGGLRARHRRGRRGDHRRRQHQSRHAGDDDRHRARDLEGGPGAGARVSA